MVLHAKVCGRLGDRRHNTEAPSQADGASCCLGRFALWSRPNGFCGVTASDGCPLANVPALDQAVKNVRIHLGELFSYRWRIASEQQHGLIGWVGERAAEHEFATIAGGPGEFEMGSAELCAPGDLVVD